MGPGGGLGGLAQPVAARMPGEQPPIPEEVVEQGVEQHRNRHRCKRREHPPHGIVALLPRGPEHQDGQDHREPGEQAEDGQPAEDPDRGDQPECNAARDGQPLAKADRDHEQQPCPGDRRHVVLLECPRHLAEQRHEGGR